MAAILPGRAAILPASLLLLLAGCYSQQASLAPRPGLNLTGLTLASPMEAVEAMVVPPVGWTAQPIEEENRHSQEVWLSPSGDTAYGVIHTHLPWPVGPNLTLAGFLKEMKRKEGEAILISRESDPELPGIRFVAEGGKYMIRGNLISKGWHAWVIFAGTLRAKPVRPDELELAERAREATVIGLPKAE